MGFITIDILKTFAGASGAVALFTSLAKRFFPGLTGRGTQAVAGVASLILAIVIFRPGGFEQGVTMLVNAAVILFAAMGWDQIINYERK